jgi:hypothetical protein
MATAYHYILLLETARTAGVIYSKNTLHEILNKFANFTPICFFA